MSAIADIIDRWRRQKVVLNSPASGASLDQLEEVFGIPLPEDVRAFYAAADGMPEFEYDRHHLSFWSIRRILQEHAAEPRPPVNGKREVAFADFLIESHRYVFRISEHGALGIGHDLAVDDEEGSLEAFFRRYIDHPDTMPVIVESGASGAV